MTRNGLSSIAGLRSFLRTTVDHATPKSGNEFDLDSRTKDKEPSSPEQSSFWAVLQDSAREALKSALGDVILGILTGQKMLENPEDVFQFTERLKTVFGVSGTKTLQFVIAKEFYKRLGLPFDPDGLFDYATFLESAKRSFANKNRRTNTSN